MITAQEIKSKAQRKYVEYLRSLLLGQSIFPLQIPCNKTYNKSSLDEFWREINDISNNSKERKGFGYSVEYQTVRTKNLGVQDLPIRVFFENDEEFVTYITKKDEVNVFKQNYQKIINQIPELRIWLECNPAKIIEHADIWDSLLKVCQYFKDTPKPNLYIRELPIAVHTKFIEQNKGILRILLSILIPTYCDLNHSNFEKCFNLKVHETQVRFRILDPQLSNQYFNGITDLAIPLSQFQCLNLPIQRVITIENKTSYYMALTLPDMSNTIVIFGSGYKVADLKQVHWLKNVELFYWGDIDAQGLEILSQLRSYFHHVRSFLMDQITFDIYFEGDLGTQSIVNSTLYLNEQEQQLYRTVKQNNWRLEQEKIPLSYVNQRILNTIF